MVLYVFGFYSKTDNVRNNTMQELLKMTEFHTKKYRPLAEKSERICYCTSLILTIWCFATCMIFHPILGKTDNLPTIYFTRSIDIFGLALHITIFVVMILITYSFSFSIYETFYKAWGAHILHFKLIEYIEENLCRNYEDFDVMNLKHDQEKIYIHLKRCTQFHDLLKR